MIWTTTRSPAGGAGAIETPTPGAVPDFIPVVGRYRTTATRRHSFHCGMNAADTLAWATLRVMFDGHPCLGDPAPSPLHQLERVPPSFLWRHLRDAVTP